MASKSTSAFEPLFQTIQCWQRHWNITDADMAKAIGCCESTWNRQKRGIGDISHTDLIRAMNVLRIPHEEAARALCAGLK